MNEQVFGAAVVLALLVIRTAVGEMGERAAPAG